MKSLKAAGCVAGCRAPMVISGSSLPESILEALGMGPGGDFQIKIVRSGDRVEIEDIEGDLDVDEDPEESAAEGAAVVGICGGLVLRPGACSFNAVGSWKSESMQT